MKRHLLLAGLLLIAAVGPTPADDERFGFSFSVGGLNTRGAVASDSANVLTLVDETDAFADEIIDPRNDNAQFGSLEIRADTMARLGAHYRKGHFCFEASVGYIRSDVGEIETQVSLVLTGPGRGGPRGGAIPDFEIFRVPAGELLRVPVQLGMLYPFREGKVFRPFAGAGVGYSFIEFSPSAEFDSLSRNLDRSLGGQARVTPVGTFGAQLFRPSDAEIGNLDGARIDAGGTFEWWVAGGAVWETAARWDVFFDVRYVGAPNGLGIGFNGGGDLGIAVPQGTAAEGGESATALYGPFFLSDGGLFDLDGDEELDPGFVYIQGGEIDLDAIGVQIGVRFKAGRRR